MAEILRVSPEEIYAQVKSGASLLVCAYDNEETCRSRIRGRGFPGGIQDPGKPGSQRDFLGVLVWTTGFTFEAVADWQLASFKADPANRGKVMNQGLWRYSRHPNYFGESLIWWGLCLITLTTPHGWWALISPLVITFLLLKVSGVLLLEKDIVRRRPEYQEYLKTTSAFIPWFPRS